LAANLAKIGDPGTARPAAKGELASGRGVLRRLQKALEAGRRWLGPARERRF